MITLITGAPGAGKTSSLVSLLRELAQGRVVFVDGIPDLKVPHVELTDPHKWMDLVPDGSAICIDEVQRVWRPGRGAVPADIAALETHRHRGLDFFIITQHPGLVHANVRALVGRHIHLRDMGILGRWWYEWPEVNEQCKPSTAVVKKRVSLDKKAHALYTSASKHIKPIRSVPRALVLLLVCVPLLIFGGYRIASSLGGKLERAKAEGEAMKRGVLPGTSVVAGASGAGRGHGAGELLSPGETTSPAQGTEVAQVKPVEMMGCIAMGSRCECLGDDRKVMTVDLKVCELNAKRGGAEMPYPKGDLTAMANLVRSDPWKDHGSSWTPAPERKPAEQPARVGLGAAVGALPRGDLTSAR